MGVLKNVVNSVVGIAKGHKVTLKEMLRPTVTVMYPQERLDLPVGSRGIPVLLSDEQGNLLCTSCGVCERECPVQVIHIVSHRGEDKRKVLDEFDIDMSRCMFCGICAEVCAFGAIAMSDQYELDDFEQGDLIYHKDQLAAIGRTQRTPITNYGIKTEVGVLDQVRAGRASAAQTAAAPATSTPSSEGSRSE
ncbi:MAG: NADH-quinone oxidoreductase subunit I [Limnochordaceae bacterium]|nr:NADH-quinone oxidoreductase subunit I [Limnochordaceae bacterium]